MLSAGGSDWPVAIVKPLGVDLADPGFWARGLSLLEKMVVQAEELARGVGDAAQSGYSIGTRFFRRILIFAEKQVG